MAADNIRQQLNFSSSDGSMNEADLTEEEKKPFKAPHYQTRSQQKVIDNLVSQQCIFAQACKKQEEVEKEAHERRMKHLRDVLDEEKRLDWVFEKRF